MTSSLRFLGAALVTASALCLLDAPPGAAAMSPAGASAAASVRSACPDVDVVFARGTNEPAGLGEPGSAFAASLAADLPGWDVTAYAVQYPASIDQLSAGAGAEDMSRHVIAVAAQCPDTLFVIGGYSQGATVTDKAVGIDTGVPYLGTEIPSSLVPRVAAVATFGNPLWLTGRDPETASPAYTGKWIDFCATGDPVCANGIDPVAHLSYVSSGYTAAAAVFAATRVISTEG